MANQTALQLTNKVLANLGESSSLSVLTSLTGLSLLVFNTINEVLYDLAFEDSYKPLETDGTITLSTATTTYTKPGGLYKLDTESFRYNEEAKVVYYSPQRFDKAILTQTDTGIPSKIIDWAGAFKPFPIANSSAHGKTIKYRYWTLPTTLATATPTGTCWIPEGFDLTLLADLVTYKILHYKHNEEASVYFAKVYGDPGQRQAGNLAKFKELWRSPELLQGDNIMAAVI